MYIFCLQDDIADGTTQWQDAMDFLTAEQQEIGFKSISLNRLRTIDSDVCHLHTYNWSTRCWLLHYSSLQSDHLHTTLPPWPKVVNTTDCLIHSALCLVSSLGLFSFVWFPHMSLFMSYQTDWVVPKWPQGIWTCCAYKVYNRLTLPTLNSLEIQHYPVVQSPSLHLIYLYWSSNPAYLSEVSVHPIPMLSSAIPVSS